MRAPDILLPWHRHRCAAQKEYGDRKCSVCYEESAAVRFLTCTAGCSFRACIRCVASLPSLPTLMAEARRQQSANSNSSSLAAGSSVDSEISWAVAQRCAAGCLDPLLPSRPMCVAGCTGRDSGCCAK